jgi:hypothetical protein
MREHIRLYSLLLNVVCPMTATRLGTASASASSYDEMTVAPSAYPRSLDLAV